LIFTHTFRRLSTSKTKGEKMKLFQNYFKALSWVMALLFAALAVGCGGGSGGGGSSASSAPGTLGVSLTDSPACGFDEVNVTVNKVRVHQSSSASDTDAGWTDITLSPARKINLLNLTNGVLDNLGQTPLAAGHYTQLRLVLDPNTGGGLANSIVPTGGVETPLVTPSAVQSGIKLGHEFDVASGQRVDLLLDFDACKSILKRGNGTYALKPVINIIPFELNGINGYVDTALLGSNVLVTAQQNGTVVQSTAPKLVTGEFLLSRLPPGNYDVVFTANDRATAVISAVSVATATSIVMVSTNAVPIALPTSATHQISGTATLNPANPTTVAYVAAKQTFGAAPAPTVTVKSVAADELSTPDAGAYQLTLPIRAPLLGTLGATLPVVFGEKTDVAGIYKVEATANGYLPQLSAEKNISLGNATQSFILVP
jgi:Domain of unknown function (DUF4382)